MNRTRAEEEASEDAPAPWGVVECAIPGGVLALVITWELTCPPSTHDNLIPRIVTCVAFLLLVAYLLNRVRRRGLKQLSEVRAVARATQAALLRPLPARLCGLALHARQLSASRGAEVGGDLYEAVATAHGVRVIMGDVRGHGLSALGAVAAVLGSFREAAYDEPGLDGVLRRLDRALQRHLREQAGQPEPTGQQEQLGPLEQQSAGAEGGRRPDGSGAGGSGPGGPGPGGLGPGGSGYDDRDAEDLWAEEFVTVLLLEIGSGGEVRALNCGHPWPYRLGRGAAPLAGAEPLPPLGTFPLPADLPLQRCGPLLPGESLFLHTDGAQDARDSDGRFFALEEALTEAAEGVAGVPLPPADVVRRVHTALLRHTGGRIGDDVALLVLRNDRVPVAASVPTRDQGPAPGDPEVPWPTGGPSAPGRTPDDRVPDVRTPDVRTPDVRTPDVRAPGEGAPEEPVPAPPVDPVDRPPADGLPGGHPAGGPGTPAGQAAAEQPVETRISDARPPRIPAPDSRPPDADMTEVPDFRAPEQRLPETATPEQRPRPRTGMTATGLRTTSSSGRGRHG